MQDITAEKTLQDNSIELFKKLGYIYISPKEAMEQRGNNENVLLKDILREKLNELNSYEYKGEKYKFSQNNIARSICDIDLPLSDGLINVNENITNTLLLGTSYEEILKDGTKKSFYFKYIDFENLDNNIFHITQEFEVLRANQNEAKKTRRADLVLFINGIPLAVIELKKSSVNYENGIRQILKEQENQEIQNLYKFIQITIAGNSNECKYGTILTLLKFYGIWREEEEQSAKEYLKTLIKNREISNLDLTLYALLSKRRILKLIKHYILFDYRVKKICRYQQFFGIERTIKRVSKVENGKRLGGFIWHTQGSGKSLTMVMLTKLLKLNFENSKIIVVTDRIDLDKQISNTFKNTDIEVKRATSGKDLLNKLQEGVSIITTLVHKFENVRASKFCISDNNIFVLIDESHRTQNGNLHNAMKKVLPNACYIGFSGTPLLRKEKNSFAKFGGEIHRYTIDNALKDGAVVPLLYEGKLVDQEVLSKEGLNRKFDLIAKDLSKEAKEDLKKKWARFQKVASSEQRLELIALDINEHFKKTLKNTGFKAIFATSSKYDATKYQEIFTKYADIKSAYVISSNDHEEFEDEHKEWVVKKWRETISKYGSEEDYLEYVCEDFIKGEEIELLIVVDKLLTGFDAPKACTLYIDKSLKEHNLLQAIARINRICEGKDCGLIVDYRGLLGELDKALDTYSSLEGFELDDLRGVVYDIREEIRKTKTYYSHLEGLFSDVKYKKDLESYVISLADSSKREEFKELLSHFARSFRQALSSEKIYDILKDEEISTYKKKVKFYNELRKVVQLRYHEACDFGKYEGQMQKLLDTFINSNEVNTLTKLVNIFDSEFDSEVERIEGKNAKADTILSAINAVVREKIELNPAFYKKIAEEIQNIIDKYKANRLDEEEKLKEAKKLQDIIRGTLQSNKDKYPKEFNNKKSVIAFYDNLKDLLDFKEILEEDFIDLSLEIDKIYKNASQKPEWNKNRDIENEIESSIEDKLWDLEDKHNININNKEKIYQILRNIGIGIYA